MQNSNAKVERFVASLTAESEFFGLLRTGHPNSFYKLYVRPTKEARRPGSSEATA